MNRVVITKAVPEEVVREALGEMPWVQGPQDREWSAEEVGPHLAACEGLVTWGFARVDARLLDRAPSLRVVANIATGVDNLDLGELARRGIWATNAPGVFAVPTAEVAIALMLGVMRRTSEAERHLRNGLWRAATPGQLDGPSLTGKVLGLVGFGNVARETARRALAFGMAITYFSRRRAHPDVEAPLQATWRPIEPLLRQSDVVSLHLPLTPDTHRLIDARALSMMKPSAYLVNTARGRLVDQAALLTALQEGQLAGAGLDVFEDEPHVPPALLMLPNVMVTPHIAGAGLEARRHAQRLALENVRRVLAGQVPLSPVNDPISAAER